MKVLNVIARCWSTRSRPNCFQISSEKDNVLERSHRMAVCSRLHGRLIVCNIKCMVKKIGLLFGEDSSAISFSFSPTSMLALPVHSLDTGVILVAGTLFFYINRKRDFRTVK